METDLEIRQNVKKVGFAEKELNLSARGFLTMGASCSVCSSLAQKRGQHFARIMRLKIEPLGVWKYNLTGTRTRWLACGNHRERQG